MSAAAEPCVSGALACGLRVVVSEIAGTGAVARALEHVPADTRSTYQNALPVGWVPIHVMETVFAEIAKELHTTVAELHTLVARRSIEQTMRTFWRMLLSITTDSALVSRTPVIFARSYNRGRLEARIVERGRAAIALQDWPDVPEWPLRATRIGIETVLTIAGRRDVRVTSSRTRAGAAFTATWH
jgi:hypothetical protein